MLEKYKFSSVATFKSFPAIWDIRDALFYVELHITVTKACCQLIFCVMTEPLAKIHTKLKYGDLYK